MWYKDGLRFKCTGCGNCCTGSPGYVWISEEEILALADYLKISVEECVKKYVRKIGNRFSLKEKAKPYDCVFLKDKKCSIYSVRPEQCRTFPWWTENLSSIQDWEEVAKRCEGINHPDAPLITLGEIQKQHE